MTRPDLEQELSVAARASTLLHFKHLIGLGVPRITLAALRLDNWGWGVVNAVDVGDGLYRPGDGLLHLILPVWDGGELIDLVAFRSGDPADWRLRTGLGLALGLQQGWERYYWQDEVTLSLTPLDWLRNGAEGLCIVDWDAPDIAMMSSLPAITCPSRQAASRLRQALTRPQPLPPILVKETALAA